MHPLPVSGRVSATQENTLNWERTKVSQLGHGTVKDAFAGWGFRARQIPLGGPLEFSPNGSWGMIRCLTRKKDFSVARWATVRTSQLIEQFPLKFFFLLESHIRTISWGWQPGNDAPFKDGQIQVWGVKGVCSWELKAGRVVRVLDPWSSVSSFPSFPLCLLKPLLLFFLRSGIFRHFNISRSTALNDRLLECVEWLLDGCKWRHSWDHSAWDGDRGAVAAGEEQPSLLSIWLPLTTILSPLTTQTPHWVLPWQHPIPPLTEAFLSAEG